MKKLDRRARTVISVSTGMSALLLFLIFRSHPVRPVGIGDPVPQLTAHTVSGNTFTLSPHPGKPLMVNFFAPWCAPCQQESPDLMNFARTHSGSVELVMVDRGDAPAMVTDYIKRYHVPSSITVLLDPNNRWSAPFGVTGQPETLFITPGGKIAYHILGPLTYAEMASYADKTSSLS